MKEIVYCGKEQKLYKVLERELPFFAYSTFQKLLRKGDIKINSHRIREEVSVKDGDVICVYLPETATPILTFTPKEVFSDENVLVLYKPKGMPVTGDNGMDEKVNAFYGKKLYLCHRLDTNTEGLIIFAKNHLAFESIKQGLKKHSITKYYLCYVFGKISKPQRLEGFLVKNSETGTVKVYDKKVEGSLKIVTELTPKEFRDGCTLLDVKLVTGRTHQIRAHLKFKGFPIVGDSKYGLESVNKSYAVKGQALLSYKIIFGEMPSPLGYLENKPIYVSTEEFEHLRLLKK